MRKIVVLLVLFLFCVPAVSSTQTRSLNVGDATINYDISGRGRTVVFIHGWAHNASVWDDQVPAFKSRYQVLRYDLRGFGRSSGFADVSADPQDLLLLLEALHVNHAYIVGHSRGGGVALRFAAAYPNRVDGLVLYAAVPPAGVPLPPEIIKMFQSLPAIMKENGLDSAGRVVLASDLAWAPPGRADVSARLRRLWSTYSGKDVLDPHPESGRVPAPTVAQLASIRVPTLVIIGDHELPGLAAAADTFARYIPNAKKVVIPNAGHIAHFAQATTFNSALMDFFFDVERNRKR